MDEITSFTRSLSSLCLKAEELRMHPVQKLYPVSKGHQDGGDKNNAGTPQPAFRFVFDDSKEIMRGDGTLSRHSVSFAIYELIQNPLIDEHNQEWSVSVEILLLSYYIHLLCILMQSKCEMSLLTSNLTFTMLLELVYKLKFNF